MLKPALLYWQAYKLRWVTAIALAVGVYLTCTTSTPLWKWQGPYVPRPHVLFVLTHSVTIVWSLGRISERASLFLHGRGFAPRTLWFHTMVASALSGGVVWLAMAASVWAGFRSMVQARFFENADFPLFATWEMPYPWLWLLPYALLLPVFHYAWIRANQPCRGGGGGIVLAIGFTFVAVFLVFSNGYKHDWFYTLAWVLSGACSLTCVLSGYGLFKHMELR